MPNRAAPRLAIATLTLPLLSAAFAADLDLRPTHHDPAYRDTVRQVHPDGRRGVAVGAAAGAAAGISIGNVAIGAGVGIAGGAAVFSDGGAAPPPNEPMPASTGGRKRAPVAVVPPGDLPAPVVPAVRPVVREVVIEEEVPPSFPQSTLRLPDASPDSSIVRIGRARGQTEVGDGRVERPMPRPGSAGELPGAGDTEGGLVVVRQELDDLITQVARFYGFDAVLTRQVRGAVENEQLPSDLNAFIARLTTDRDLVFYFRNRDLNVSARSENVSRVIGLGPSDPRELRAAIEAAGVDSDRFPLRFIEASNSVLVDGPPSFVALVEVIAESLVRTERNSAPVTVIRGNQINRQSPTGDVPQAAAVPATPE